MALGPERDPLTPSRYSILIGQTSQAHQSETETARLLSSTQALQPSPAQQDPPVQWLQKTSGLCLEAYRVSRLFRQASFALNDGRHGAEASRLRVCRGSQPTSSRPPFLWPWFVKWRPILDLMKSRIQVQSP